MAILIKFAELFSNGALPKNMWACLVYVLMYPFLEKLPEERIPSKPALRPVTVGSVLTRFGYRVMVRMNMVAVAEKPRDASSYTRMHDHN